MPRKHRAARERAASSLETDRPTRGAPLWATGPGLDVRVVSGDKVYRCPGCDHEIRRGLPHLVVIPGDAPEERRHWHNVCWQQELRRRKVRR
jgi:hypothetical protein